MSDDRAYLLELRALLAEHAAWSTQVLNLSPAEGLMSRTARRMLDSDLAGRLSEGLPGSKDPSMPAEMHQWSCRVEEMLAGLLARLFGARFADWRPLSNSMANAVVLSAVTRPGDVIAVQSLSGGGNLSYQAAGVCAPLGLSTVELPGRADFDIDVPTAIEVIERNRPRVVVLGGSKVIFPYRLREIASAAQAVGADVLFDAAHLGPFIAAGLLDSPLTQGATVVTLGTHKLMGGPVGGIVLTDDEGLAERIHASIEPRFLQTRDVNKYAAAVVSLAELDAYGGAYAGAIRANVAALSSELDRAGVPVVGRERGWSQTHMLFVACADAPGACAALARNGLLVSNTALAGQDAGRGERGGLRMSVALLTRRGMGTAEMAVIAALIVRAMVGADVRAAVSELAARFPLVRYSFDEES